MPDDYRVDLQLGDGNVHQFLFVGGPIEHPDQNQAILSAIGLAATSWARMEQHIDAILIQINKAEHSNETLDLYDPDHPRPFSDKLDMLRDYFNKHPALAKHRDTVRDFVSGLKNLAVQRNEIMHGILENYDPNQGTFCINGANYRKKTNDFLFRKQTIEFGSVADFIRVVNIGHYGLCEISKELFTTDALSQLQMSQSQTPS